ncbi:MAG: DUF3237 domain-containing protein [Alphaproteobacteria bacterium]|nr:DUF3237 domain-containing protein [Alphaproteobacteria bacterium]MBU0792379.1 DUF3237 domain-containing protein [Alphaproteobacteria bacterium]MBU0877143.1 DUF3237 domain-containing protein [Alphaproteobacteria bacterium]MBU1770717.1 DUF3237 domain-containing protein [Alphaproteobacteria bacterium]
MTDDPLALRYEHVFDIRINFDKRWTTGAIHEGGPNHGYTSVGEGCTISGPRLNGKLVDYSGADWPVIRTDKVVELNAHYMIEADDGALIYIRNLGYVHGPLDLPDGTTTSSYFRCTPYFRAPEGKHGWLNRTVIVGVGQRRPKLTPEDEQDHSLFRYYAVI